MNSQKREKFRIEPLLVQVLNKISDEYAHVSVAFIETLNYCNDLINDIPTYFQRTLLRTIKDYDKIKNQDQVLLSVAAYNLYFNNLPHQYQTYFFEFLQKKFNLK
jgi:hypothetical protein